MTVLERPFCKARDTMQRHAKTLTTEIRMLQEERLKSDNLKIMRIIPNV